MRKAEVLGPRVASLLTDRRCDSRETYARRLEGEKIGAHWDLCPMLSTSLRVGRVELSYRGEDRK